MELSTKETVKGKPYVIGLNLPKNNIATISNRYSEVLNGERLALFGATGFLEIAINTADASKLLGLNLGDTIRIEFDDSTDS